MLTIMSIIATMWSVFMPSGPAVPVSPSTLQARIQAAPCGAVITLPPADYGAVTITRRCTRPITIEAGAARMLLTVSKAQGIKIVGGTFGPATDKLGYAAVLRQSDNISFTRSRFLDSKRGLVIDRSTHVLVDAPQMTGLAIDGVNIASSQDVTIRNGRFESFVTGKAHPDAIQGWSRPATGITARILIEDNVIAGDMQGIFFGNHIRAGVDDGGFDDVTIRNNSVQVAYPQGIALMACRGRCVVTGNQVSRKPGARWKASINVTLSPSAVVEQNRVGG